jgi:hypothetical protein
VWLIGSRLMTAPEINENSVQWPFGLGTINEVPARFPPSKIDAAAKRVTVIGRELSNRAAQRTPIQSYLAKQMARPDDSADAAPPVLRHFLDEHVAAIDELRTMLSSGAPPRWEVNIAHRDDELPVDLGDQFQLIRVLAVDAFDHHSRGDDATAWRDAETGWVLARGLWAQPDVYSRLTALSGTRLMNAVAAKLSAPAPDWHRQLLAFDADREFAAGLQVEAWTVMTAWDRRQTARKPDDAWGGSAEVVLGNVRRRRAATYAGSRRRAAEEIAAKPPCGHAPANRSGLAIADLLRSHLDRFHVEREAAAKLLALKEQHRRSGEWPEAMPGIGESVCGNDAWHYRRATDGSMSLVFRYRLEEDSRPAVLPLSFRYPK